MSILALMAEARRTKRRFGIGLWRQCAQAAYLRYSRCQLDPWEYYFFQVYLDHFPMDEKKRFVGWRREIVLDRAANHDAARKPANDKLLFHSILSDAGAPVPKLFAVYSDHTQRFPGAARLHDADQVADYLRNQADQPFFIKPVRGAHGLGVMVIGGVAPERSDLLLVNGERRDIRSFAAALDPQDRSGWMFQELLCSHPSVSALCGERLTSVRLIVVLSASGPEILSAVWRVPTGNNVTDNFDVGQSGNIAAGVEGESGRVLRIVQGAGWDTIRRTHHPDTGMALDDFSLPFWTDTQDLCLRLAKLFPKLRLQHWDIALTERGPVVIEVNVEGGMRTHQIVRQRGIYGPELAEFG